MKRASALFILLLTVSYFCSCERDDICDETAPTTSGLVIAFFERNNQTQPKNVFNLKVIAEGMTEGVPLDDAGNDITSSNTITIPLRTDADATTYRFIYNSTGAQGVPLNEDLITFNYTRNEIYIGRACGYTTRFNLDDDDDVATVLTDTTPADQLWISGITVEKNNIDDENEAHISIYF